MTTEIADIFIIGGGINGVGIARDAAGRGQTVVLVEQDDLASATSSSSSKLIHGGLRYLEYYDFGLVRESLKERETLWKIAPHLIKARRFILPHHSGLRPAWFLRLGLFLYDHIGGRKLLPGTKTLKFANDSAANPLKAKFIKGFEYSDCCVDDARLVVLNALSAHQSGATILPRHRFISAKRKNGCWHIDVETDAGQVMQFEAKVLINAAGPWVDAVVKDCHPTQDPKSSVRLVKGSHIIVPKLYDYDKAYTFQNADGRIIFSIPYQEKYTLIGTTDVAFDAAPNSAEASGDEIVYLCAAASEYFKEPINPTDVIWTYSGVRSLYDDGKEDASAITRKYVFELDIADGILPLISIFGGKLTTYRELAEDVLEKLAPYMQMSRGNWTDTEPLPGGDLPSRENPEIAFGNLISDLTKAFPWLDGVVRKRLARAYGTRAFDLLGNAQAISDLGQHFGAGLYEKEVKFLIRQEWAQEAEDILWRRSKLGLHMTDVEKQAVANYMQRLRL